MTDQICRNAFKSISVGQKFDEYCQTVTWISREANIREVHKHFGSWQMVANEAFQNADDGKMGSEKSTYNVDKCKNNNVENLSI